VSEDLFRAAMLLRHRVELDHAVARFQTMKLHIEQSMALGLAYKYTMADLDEAAERIAACAPDPHNYA
jgi:hypothetical protein